MESPVESRLRMISTPYVGPVDALVDELLIALRDADPPVLIAGADPKVLAAYNRLYCELHDKATNDE